MILPVGCEGMGATPDVSLDYVLVKKIAASALINTLGYATGCELQHLV